MKMQNTTATTLKKVADTLPDFKTYYRATASTREMYRSTEQDPQPRNKLFNIHSQSIDFDKGTRKNTFPTNGPGKSGYPDAKE